MCPPVDLLVALRDGAVKAAVYPSGQFSVMHWLFAAGSLEILVSPDVCTACVVSSSPNRALWVLVRQIRRKRSVARH